MFEQQDPPRDEGMNFKQKLVVIFANVLILAELTTSIISATTIRRTWPETS